MIGSYHPKWSPDGKWVAFTWNSGMQWHVARISPHDNTLVPLPNADEGMGGEPSWSPDGKQIAFGAINSEGAYVINSDQPGGYTSLMSLCLCDLAVWSPRGDKILIQAEDQDVINLYSVNLDGSDRVNLTQAQPASGNPIHNTNPVWSPDGMQIMFISDRSGDGEIYVMNADGSSPVRLTNGKEMAEGNQDLSWQWFGVLDWWEPHPSVLSPFF